MQSHLLTNATKEEPLHISTFHVTPTVPERTSREYHLHLHSTLDIFNTRGPDTPDGNYNLLFAIDERLAFFGWITLTNIKFIIGVDMEGKSAPEQASLEGGTARSNANQQPNGIRYQDLAPAFFALRRAYARVLRDPFYEVKGEDEDELEVGKIKNEGFQKEVKRIGEYWYPGIAAL